MFLKLRRASCSDHASRRTLVERRGVGQSSAGYYSLYNDLGIASRQSKGTRNECQDRENDQDRQPRPHGCLGRGGQAACLSRLGRSRVQGQRGRACRAGSTGPVEGRSTAGLMAIPGFVNVHSHPFSEPANKGLTEEFGSDSSARARSTSTSPVFGLAPEDAAPRDPGGDVGAPEKRRHHLNDLSMAREGWVDDLAGPASAPWSADDARRACGTRRTATPSTTLGREGRREVPSRRR